MGASKQPPIDYAPRVDRVLAGVSTDAVPIARRDALCRYLELVATWNEHYDLTAARDADEMVDLFIADAALLACHAHRATRSHKTRPGFGGDPAAVQLTASTVSWVDVGSGAGAPGLPLAILCPELQVTLVEPRSKRVAFLRTVLGTLELEHVRVQRARADELADRSADVALSRATLPPEAWLAEGGRIAEDAVWVLLAQAEPPSLPGWQVDLDLNYRWPLTAASRRAVRFSHSR